MWSVHNSGYHWVAVRQWGGPRTVLCPIDPEAGTRAAPPIPKDLHEQFVSLQRGGDYTEFANTYGLLGVGLRNRETFQGPVEVLRYAESEIDWHDAIRDAWRVSLIWRRLTRLHGQLPPTTELPHIFKARDVAAPSLQLPTLEEFVADPTLEDFLVQRHAELKKELDVYGPKSLNRLKLKFLMEELQTVTNRWLAEFVAPVISWKNGGDTVSLQFAEPRSVAGAVWQQLADKITSQRTPRPCRRPGCAAMIDPIARRRHARYCSDLCRTSEHQRLRGIAVKELSTGKPPRVVATEIGVTLKQVESWRRRARRRRT